MLLVLKKLLWGISYATISVLGVFFKWRVTLVYFNKENIAIIFPPVPFSLWSLGIRVRFTFKEVTFQFAYLSTDFFPSNFSLASFILNGSHVYSLFMSWVGLDWIFYPLCFCFVLLFIMCSIFPFSKVKITLLLARKGG